MGGRKDQGVSHVLRKVRVSEIPRVRRQEVSKEAGK